MWELDCFLLREKLEVRGSLPIVCQCARDAVYGRSVSAFPTHFDVSVFSLVQCVAGAQLLSGFCSVVTSSCIAIYLIYLCLKVSSGTSYIAILVNPSNCNFYF